jgi:hypothetical protein
MAEEKHASDAAAHHVELVFFSSQFGTAQLTAQRETILCVKMGGSEKG